jgi:folate-binding protein YgfZ
MPVVQNAFSFVRLLASGRDRAKFLHNFCTNNIKALETGSACEAFFTDVKARILAHGYVLAFEDAHEIWISPGDPAALLKHLNRYIITEDVAIVADDPSSATLCFHADENVLTALRAEQVAIGGDELSDGAIAAAVDQTLSIRFGIGEAEQNTAVTGLLVTWAKQPVLFLTGPAGPLAALGSRLDAAGVSALSNDEIESLRIDERYPLMGRDMASENMAPEAERNVQAISYTKGCYLGQEPIARLDAMGHVNRALRVVEISGPCEVASASGCPLKTTDGTTAGTLTSVILRPDGISHGLAMVKVNSIHQPLHVTDDSGNERMVHVRSA